MILRFFALTLFVFVAGLSQAQVRVENASFEGEAQDATTPVRWHECSDETTPDILPGFWGVTTEAADGETFMGLITRDIGSWEAVGQRLPEPLVKDMCYEFSVELAHSPTYAGYNLPVKLLIWGSRTRCDRKQLLGEVPYVDHPDWKKYKFEFTADKDFPYIIIEAGYIDGLTFPYKGNILIDNCSAFQLCKRA
ncbi:MAG: hypothetical protein HKN16_11675 [Saprospiraceae bacterium]|nr:hypothetical protein [Saprospiraceae bacterium]